jgi:hypothetical protein
MPYLYWLLSFIKILSFKPQDSFQNRKVHPSVSVDVVKLENTVNPYLVGSVTLISYFSLKSIKYYLANGRLIYEHMHMNGFTGITVFIT